MPQQNDRKDTLLIIDDTIENIKILGITLGAAGYAVLTADSGEQGFLIAKEKMPDLILLDVQMPIQDGYETCEKLKKDPATAEIPVIFLTALNSSDDVVHGFKAGGVDYIIKPFNKYELLARITTHIELTQARAMQKKLILDLSIALEQVKQLTGLLPMCASCKKIRDDGGYWQYVEKFIADHSEAKFTHSLCPDCVRRLYPDIAETVIKRDKEKHQEK